MGSGKGGLDRERGWDGEGGSGADSTWDRIVGSGRERRWSKVNINALLLVVGITTFAKIYQHA